MERRRSIRVPLEVWVEQWTDREMYLQKSANLSRGGIYLERTVPHPEGTLLNLRFSLPEDERPIECKGRIVYPRADQEFGMGLEFVELDDDEARRITEYVSDAQATAEGRRSEDPGARETGARETGARETGARETGAREAGARDPDEQEGA